MIEIVSMWSGTPAPTVVDIDSYLSKPKTVRTEGRLAAYSGYMAGIAASAIYLSLIHI